MKLWRLLVSIELCLVLSALVCIAMAAGSFDLKGEYAAAINSMPLLVWLREVPVTASWWLWLTLVLLALLFLNTVLCSSETLWNRWGKGGWWNLMAPQFIHVGFLLIVVAHLLSATGSSQMQVEVQEGQMVRLPNGAYFGVAKISVSVLPNGMPIGFSSELVTNLQNPAERIVISPNNPWFSRDYGIYIKQAQEYPFRRALLEAHREPGAGMALAGAVLFSIGTVILLVIRSKTRENEQMVDMPEAHITAGG